MSITVLYFLVRNCVHTFMEAGGVMDGACSLWAGAGLGPSWRGSLLAADWYISHYALEKAGLAIPHNPESWVAGLAKLKHVPVQTKAVCELPFVLVRFVDRRCATAENTTTNIADIVVKRYHYQAARHDDRCWSMAYGAPIEPGTWNLQEPTRREGAEPEPRNPAWRRAESF